MRRIGNGKVFQDDHSLVNELTAGATERLQLFTKENTAKSTIEVYKELLEN